MTAWAHQLEVIPKLLAGNFLLIWDAGSGKTLPLLQAASQRGGRTLYLGPPAIRTQVSKEAQVFDCYDCKDIQVVQYGKDKVAPQAKLVICSYDHLIDPKLWKQLFKMEWDTLILDEGHLLKNTAAKRTRAVYGSRRDSPGALIRRAKRVWVATGTPIVNDPSDFWPHVSRLMPKLLKLLEIEKKSQWIDMFCHTRQTPYGPVVTGGKNLEILRGALGPYTSRAKKENILDLPPLLITQLWVPARDIDLDGVPTEALQELERLLEHGTVERLGELMAPLATLRRRIGMLKAAHCADIVKAEAESGGGKTILFYHHKDVGEALVEQLRPLSIFKGGVAHYTGGMAQAKRDAVVKQFTGDKNCRVLVAQIMAAGTGLNLQAAERIIIVEPAWTPASNEQAIARAYRAGQKKKVWASFVCLENSIDERITSALVRKQRIIDGAVG
jgi:SNF2 family DNA or RNA helicase